MKEMKDFQSKQLAEHMLVMHIDNCCQYCGKFVLPEEKESHETKEHFCEICNSHCVRTYSKKMFTCNVHKLEFFELELEFYNMRCT